MELGKTAAQAPASPSPAEDRARYTELIVRSTSAKKLAVAGPGTGKTYTFREALRAAGGRGLALTFINNLARDLKVELAEVADSYTFHGFCRYRLHRMRVDGLTPHFHYYPSLPLIVSKDMEFLGRSGIDDKEIERCLQNLDDGQGTISESLRIAAYYDAVGHTDSVYRVLRHLESNRDEIPTCPLVVVDEYQDFSLLETTFIGLLAERSPVLITGDDDQALYGFKHASANYIRALAQDASYSKFELPYCSRCTQVIVNAVHDVLNRAQSLGLLAGRLPKPYRYYPPDKKEHSERHSQIIHAHCTVENNRAPYIGRYVVARITEIPEEEIRASREGRYPTALVIGPVEFVRRVYPIIQERFPNAILKESSPSKVSILDGYQYLYRDGGSRLGWRIVLFCDAPANTQEIVRTALGSDAELSVLIPSEFREHHIRMAGLVGKVIRGEALATEEKTVLESMTGHTFDVIEKTLRGDTEQASDDQPGTPQSANDATIPSVICTSLRGAKGLSANRVFIVGFNNGHFPRNPTGITDDEVCSLLVGLSRTRRQCYLVSCGRFGNVRLQPSVFLDWIGSHVTTESVDKTWMRLVANRAQEGEPHAGGSPP